MEKALVLNLLRFVQELIPQDEFSFPKQDLKDYGITTDEFKMAEQLVKGLRSDKSPLEISQEVPLTVNHSITTLTHPDKVLYPSISLTKLDLANYYERVADYLLPFIKNRPITILRCPEGSQNWIRMV